MKRVIATIVVLCLGLLSIVSCKPAGDISYLDDVKWNIDWDGYPYTGGIMVDNYKDVGGVIYVDGYYKWFGSIKGWVYQNESIIIKSPRITIRHLGGKG